MAYDGHSLSYIIDQTIESTLSLISGKIYRLRYKAVNAIGSS